MAQAQGSLPTAPFQMAATNHVIVGVAWDESVIARMLPAGIRPVAGAPGAINIFTVDRGFGIARYQPVYFWVDVEGFDSPDGTKGRWMRAGAYGPNDNTSAVLREVHGFPVRNGSTRLERTADGKRATSLVGGKEVVVAEVKSSDECGAAGGPLCYPTAKREVNENPFAGGWCNAEPVSVIVVAPAGRRLRDCSGPVSFATARFCSAGPSPCGRAALTVGPPGPTVRSRRGSRIAI